MICISNSFIDLLRTKVDIEDKGKLHNKLKRLHYDTIDDDDQKSVQTADSFGNKILWAWFFVQCMCLWFNLYSTPAIMLEPELNERLRTICIFNELVWALDIIRMLMFNAPDGEDSFAFAIDYIKGQFIFDILATLPQLLSFFSAKFVILKLLRLSHLSLVIMPFRSVVNTCFSNRGKLFNAALISAFQTCCYIVILLHYLGCLWIFIGSEYFLDFEKGATPWTLDNDDFKNMSQT